LTFCADTDLVGNIWKLVSKHISKENQPRVANKLAILFENCGCDTLQETPLWDLITLRCYCYKEDKDSLISCLGCKGSSFRRKTFD